MMDGIARLPTSVENDAPSEGEADLELVEAAARGDPRAVDALCGRVARPMLRTLRRLLGSASADVEDVLQDALLAMFQGLGSYRAEAGIEAYACGIAVRKALVFLRRGRTQKRAEHLRADGHDADSERSGLPSPQDELDAR